MLTVGQLAQHLNTLDPNLPIGIIDIDRHPGSQRVISPTPATGPRQPQSRHAIATTPDEPTPVELVENGRRSLRMVSMADAHGATMASITVGFLASLIGSFGLLDEHLHHCVVDAASADPDRGDRRITEAVVASERLLRA